MTDSIVHVQSCMKIAGFLGHVSLDIGDGIVSSLMVTQ